MPTSTDTVYWKVIGTQIEDDGTVTHLLREVADFQGNPLPITDPAAAMPRRHTYNLPAAQEKPRGTIIKIEITTSVTRNVTINPTS